MQKKVKAWKNCSSSCLGQVLDAGMGRKFLTLPGLSSACHRLSQCQPSTFATAATSFPSRQPEISSCLLRQILPQADKVRSSSSVPVAIYKAACLQEKFHCCDDLKVLKSQGRAGMPEPYSQSLTNKLVSYQMSTLTW